MRDFFAWNFSLPWRVMGVRIRVHALFLLLASGVLLVALKSNVHEAGWWGAFLAILFGSTLLHELGHCQVARRRGGAPHEVVIWPFGGLVQVSVPHSAANEIVVALAGPLVNLLIASFAACVLLLRGDLDAQAFNLLHLPFAVGPLTWVLAAKLCLWINLWAVAINLLPALPMDGGRALRGLLWWMIGRRRAVRSAHRFAQMTGAAMCFLPEILRLSDMPVASYVGIPLLGLGAFLMLSSHGEERRPRRRREQTPAHNERPEEGPGQLLLSAETQPLGFSPAIGQAVETRLEEKLRRQRDREEEEDRRVDEILARLGASGLESLAPEERDLLQRASARYRNRR